MKSPSPDPGRARARARDAFDAVAANAETKEKLRRNKLQRRARACGLQLRHSDYGYSLISVDRKRVDDRNDLTLDDVAAHLDGASAGS